MGCDLSQPEHQENIQRPKIQNTRQRRRKLSPMNVPDQSNQLAQLAYITYSSSEPSHHHHQDTCSSSEPSHNHHQDTSCPPSHH